MSVVRDAPLNKPIPGPGVWLGPDEFNFCIAPMHRDTDGREYIPFSWASDYQPVGDFVLRFPNYWIADKVAECWVGERSHEGGVYWCRRERNIPGST